MATITKYGSAKRFGPRYGRTTKARWGKIQTERAKKQTCPYCHKLAVKRLASGIWYCKKCRVKFTGFAYTVSKRITFEEESPIAEEPVKKSAKEED